eukprot:1052219-Rhodomonas_salina.2
MPHMYTRATHTCVCVCGARFRSSTPHTHTHTCVEHAEQDALPSVCPERTPNAAVLQPMIWEQCGSRAR